MEKKLHLAFVLHRYFPYGGLQRDALAIAKECLAQGHQVEFLTMNWQGATHPDMPVHIFTKKHWINYCRYKAFEQDVQEYISAHHFDGIIGFNKMAGLDIYYAADPCFIATLAQRNLGKLFRFSPRYHFFLNAEARLCAPESKTHLLLISPQALEDFKKYYALSEDRLHFLLPGIHRDRCWQPNAPERRLAMRQQLAISADHHLILMLGSGFKTKGVDRSIRALAALPFELREKTTMLVVGKDNPKTFQFLAKKLGVEKYIQFILGSDQVPDLLLAADMLLHPAYMENTGTVLLEAMVAGLPVLTTANCGYAFYIQQAQAGYVLPLPFNQQQLNDKLAFVLTSKEREQWQANGIRFGQMADIYNMPKRAAELIEKLIEEKQLNKDLYNILSEKDIFTSFMQLPGQIYREVKQRKTIKLALDNKTYFAKIFSGVSIKEIIKNLFKGQWPVIDAFYEHKALLQLAALGIEAPKVVAYKSLGLNPLTRKSFIVMEAIEPSISLEDYVHQWSKKPLAIRRALINKVAHIAHTMHKNGIQHRDFYLCHFLLRTPYGEEQIDPENINLALIDLHRARFKTPLPARWLIKDLAALYFSALGSTLTSRDYYRFLKIYTEQPLRVALADLKWKKIEKRAKKLYIKIHSR